MATVKTMIESPTFGKLFFDAVFSTEHTSNVTVTEHPVQVGAPITDHAYQEPDEVTMEIGMKYEGKGYQPVYTRTALTDALHDALGFCTSKQIVLLKSCEISARVPNPADVTCFCKIFKSPITPCFTSVLRLFLRFCCQISDFTTKVNACKYRKPEIIRTQTSGCSKNLDLRSDHYRTVT